MGLAEDLKALQELREKGELSEAAYQSARDAALYKHGASSSGSFQAGRFVGLHPIAVIILALVVALGLVLLNRNKLTGSPSSTAVQLAPNLPPQPTQRFATITNSAITVAANSLYWFPFQVPSGASAVRVQGHFTATGGMGNDIIVYVSDADGFINLRNGHQTNVYYNSQKVTQESINAVLPNTPGTYYLIFDNRFSLITPKAVAVNATLTYIQ